MKRIYNNIRYAFALIILFYLSSVCAQQSFEFVVLPDTQTYIDEFPEVYHSQIDWIVDNKDRFSFVLHVGDITQNNSEEEWTIAHDGLSKLNGLVPYALALGNHDMGSKPGIFADTRNTDWANKFFPLKKLRPSNKIIASFPEGTIDNTASEFIIQGKKWLIVSLEFGPRNKTIKWANDIIESHPDHLIIINTHAYLFHDNTFLDDGDWALPKNYGVGKLKGEDGVNDGAQLWNKLVSQNKNILMVFTGHITGKGVGTLVSEGEHGNKVYQMLANYQKNVKGVEKGDSGYLRIIEINTSRRTISVKTYSPWLDQFLTDTEQEFIFENVEF